MSQLRFIFAAILAVCSSHALGEDVAVFIRSRMTLQEYAKECGRPIDKPNYSARLSGCFSYLDGAAEQIGIAKGSPMCWDELRSGAASPARLGELLIQMGGMPEYQNRRLGEALRWTLVEVSAPACK